MPCNMLTIKFSTNSTEIIKQRQFQSLQSAQHWALDDIQCQLPFSLLHDVETPVKVDGLTWQTCFKNDCYSIRCNGLGCYFQIEYCFAQN